MKALWFLPFAFAGGAEGFALFAPYLIGVLTLLYVVRALRASADARREAAAQLRSSSLSSVDILPTAQPAL